MSAPEKPAYGSPCNGCGLCCIAEQCPIGELLLGPHRICPALMDVGSAFVCGLMTNPELFYKNGTDPERLRGIGKSVGLLLGAGRGCDAHLITEPEPTPEISERMRGERTTESNAAIATIVSSIPHLRRWPGGR